MQFRNSNSQYWRLKIAYCSRVQLLTFSVQRNQPALTKLVAQFISLILIFCGFRMSKSIYFYDLENLYRVVPPEYCYVIPSGKSWKWATLSHMTSSSALLFCDTGSKIICVDCSTCHPISLHDSKSFCNIQGLCCIPGSGPYLVVADDTDGLLCYKYDLDHRCKMLNLSLVWCVKGRTRTFVRAKSFTATTNCSCTTLATTVSARSVRMDWTRAGF